MKFVLRTAINALTLDYWKEYRGAALANVRKCAGPCNRETALQWCIEKRDSLTANNCDGWIDEYGFYDMPESVRQDMVGRSFRCGNDLCFVIGLSEKQFNYGSSQGLLYVPSPRDGWFKVGALSPDDLDVNLDFNDVSKYGEVLEVLRSMAFVDVTYREVLAYIQSEVKSGKLY